MISQAALIEFDLLMKARGLTSSERRKVWNVLYKLISIEDIELLTPLDILVASYLVDMYKFDYFGSLIATQCIVGSAEPLTTDKEIIGVVLKARHVIHDLKRMGIVF